MRRSPSLLLGSLSALALLLSCVDGDEPISPVGGDSVRVPVSAQVAASAADASARPINRIRVVGRAVPGGEVLGEATVDVDPTADVWNVPLELRLEGLLTEVMVDLALIHVDAAGAEFIEYSGRVGPLTVRPGDDAPSVNVPVVRGPPDNIGVSAVDITNAAPALVEGGSRTLQATVTNSVPGTTPTVFWTSLSPANLSFTGALATALLPGTATVVATSGPVSDTATIQIVQRPAGVTINPTSATLDLGTEVVFTGAVVDPRGGTIAGQPVLWRSLDPSILEALTGGRFRAIGSGSGRAEVRAAADTTLKAVGTVRVNRRPVDVAVTKSTGTTQAFVGDAVVFTVAAANQGDAEATNVRVRDQLPAGLTLEGATPSAGTFDAATGTWTVGTLAAGARATLELRTRLSSGASGTVITNTAEKVASEDQQDPNPGNDRASASFTIGQRIADLSLSKAASRATIFEGDTVTFTVTVTNGGNQPVANLAVADSLPAGLSIVSDVATRGAFERTLRSWAVGTLAAGESVQLRIQMRALSGSAGTQTNVARILSWDGPSDPNTVNNRATAAVTVQVNNQADVAVTKTAAVTSLLEGDTASFSVKVKNLGPLVASGVEVKDSLPSGLTYVSATPASGTFSANTMIWTVGTLAVGDSALMSVRATVNSGTTGQTLTNTARYLASGPTADGVAGNNTATASVTVVPRASNVEVVKVADVSNPFENTRVRFTVTATNLGPYDVTNLRIKDKLPAGLTLDSVRTATGTVAGDSLWTIPSLAVSSSVVLSAYVLVNDLTGGTTITNQASRLSMDQSDPVPGNDVGSAALTVRKRNLDLEVRKTASVAQPAVTSAFIYTVVVKNRGPGTATSIVIADTLPTLLTIDSVRTTVGSFASSAWSIPTLVVGDSAIMRVYVHVPQAASAQTITNRARRVSQAQADSNAVNDTMTVSQSVPVNNPPVVTITAPPNQGVYDPGDTITFTATADDQEDGPLTSTIVWTSNVSGAMGTGGTVTRSNLSPGPHLVIARVTDSHGNISADTVPLTIAIVTTPTTLNVPFGGTASMPISLSAPAPSGGLVLTITSADTTKVRVLTPTVTIPAGALSANAQLSGVQPGTAVVTASTQGYGSSSTSVSVTAALNIVQGSVSFPQGHTSPGFTIRLESQNVQIAAPSGGVTVTLTAASPACVTVPATVTIPAGQVSVNATATYGGTATTPCNTTVTASATSITSDAFQVYVNTPPALTVYTPVAVGSGLVTTGSVQLDYAQHGGVTVRVQSLNPALALVAPNATTAGTAFVDFPLTNGAGSFTYYVQGLEAVTGNAVIQATVPGFLQDTTTTVVQQPAVALASLGTSYTSLNADVPFYAMVGVSDIYYGGVNAQNVRAGGAPLTVTISSTDTTIARLVKTAGGDDTVTVTIPVGQYYSPTNVALGGVALDLKAAGTTTVGASVPGFIQRPGATVNVTVTAPGITTYASQVGGGLQTNTQAYLGSGNHGGVTVQLVSADPNVALLSPNATTAGTATLNVAVPNGQTQVNYYVHGVETAVAQVASVPTLVRITAPGFVSDSAAVTVSQPYVTIYNLGASHTSLDPNQAFYAAVGLSDTYYGGVSSQQVRAGGPTLTVTFTSSDSSKARLVTTASSGNTVTAQIVPGQYYTPTTVAAGGVALDPLAAGSTTVQASIPGFLQRPGATVAVTVTAPAIQVSPITVGAALQAQTSAYLGAPAPAGGLTVNLVSSNPAVALLSPNATTAGTSTLTVTVPQNQSSVGYYVQGIAGTTGSSIITVSAPGFTTDTASASIIQPYVTLYNVSGSTTTLSPNQAFYAAVGLSDIYYGGVSGQNVRAGGAPLTVTINSDNQGVGQLQTTAGTSGTATVTIPVGQYYSPQTVATGGVAFDPYGAGTTNVSGSIPGFLQRPGAIVAVTVTSPGITMSSLTVGSGLMAQGNVSLGASSHGGVTLRIRSSSGAIAKVSANNTTAGTDSVDIVVPNGTSSVQFWVHGMEGQTGTVTFTASAAGFTDGSAAQTIVQPGVVILSLPTSIAVAAADRLFTVYVGTPSGSSVNGQVRRAGAAPLVATVTSSQPSVGTLVTSAGAGASRTLNIAAGAAQSPGSIGAGGIAFDPLTTGSTTVNATIAGFISQPNATVNVTVTP